MGRRRGNQSSSIVPRPLPQNPVIRRCLRYTSTAGGVASVYRNCLLSMMMVASTTNTTVIFPIQAVRVRKIEMWALSASASAQRVAVIWGHSVSPGVEITAYGNVSNPAHLVTKPPAGSYAAQWQVHSTPQTTVGLESNLIFQTSATAESIMDIHFDMLLEGVTQNFDVGDVASGVKVGTTAGVLYAYLDSLNAAGSAAGTQNWATVLFTTAVLASRTP